MRIVICDDDTLFLESFSHKLEALFSERSVPCSMRLLNSGKELCDEMGRGGNDVYFLDMDMPDMSGIELAQKIRQVDCKTLLLFVTNREDLVFESIRFHPFRYIRKERLDQELKEAVDAILGHVLENEQIVEFWCGQEFMCIPASKIFYIESAGHYLHIHIQDKVYTVRGKISEYEKLLEESGFIRVHKGYLVNGNDIYSISSESVVLENGTKLPASRKKINGIKRLHMEMTRKQVYGNHG